MWNFPFLKTMHIRTRFTLPINPCCYHSAARPGKVPRFINTVRFVKRGTEVNTRRSATTTL